ncbi:E-selectin-like [Aplochiton taeniatus]
MDWETARGWCRKNYTDMVAIQNQEEISHLNDLLPRQNTYYWIGIRKVKTVWTWVGTNKSLTEEATNWATDEPNNSGNNEDCVEMYVKRENDMGMWNDESCMKKKTALCYTASCETSSCPNGECVETINSHRCECSEGFYGDICQHVVQCKGREVSIPAKAYVQCPGLEDPENGSVDCGVDLERQFSYGSSCSFRCAEGYRLQGASTTTCTSAAKWTEETSRCTAITCKKPVGCDHLRTECSPEFDELLLGSICRFSCDSGFQLKGASSSQCTGDGEWSLKIPLCIAIKCPALQKPENGAAHCGEDSKTQFSYGSICWFSCNLGFELQGAANSKCTSEGDWSSATPTCKAKQCPPPSAPLRGQVNCLSISGRAPHPQGLRCTYSCEEGHDLQGVPDIECTKSGDWSSTTPTCSVVKCPVLQAPANGNLNCSDEELIFGSQCSVTCAQGHTQHRHDFVTCDHYGNWSGELPICQASPEPLLSPAAIGLAGAGAASLSGLFLAVWLLKRFKQKANQFDLSSISDVKDPPQVYRNSIGSLI